MAPGRALAGLLGAVLLGLPAAAQGVPGAASEGGIEARWRFTPGAEGDPSGVLDVTVRDQRTGNPIRYPSGALLAWLQRDRAALIEETETCADRVLALATQGVGRRADVDLNGYRIVSLNSDGSVAFINPYVGFNNAKLESITDLGATPLDWVQDRDRMEIWVLLAEPGRLARLDLQTRTVRRELALPAGAGATRLALDAAGRRLWLAMPGIGAIGSVDLVAAEPRLETRPAAGVTALLASGDGAAAWADADHRLGFVAGARAPERVALPAAPVAIRRSGNAGATVVATADGGILLLPDAAGAAARSVAVGHPVQAMEAFDDGRFVLAVGGGAASVVDLASLRVTLRFAVRPGADGIAMTERYAYAIDAASGHAGMVALDDLRHGKAAVIDIIVAAEGGAALAGGPARVVADPEGSGLLVASDRDGMITQYSEGMMAPSGSYSNYRRAAVGLDLVDYSLREVASGHYRAVVRTEAGGRFELLLGGIRPRFSSCSTLTLPGPEAAAEAAPTLRAELVAAGSAAAPAPGAERVRVRVTERLPARAPAPVAGLRDLTLLVFDKHSGWQRRVALAEVGSGEYEGEVRLPRSAAYELLASSSSANLSFVEGRMGERVLGPQP